jgi:hypothetical protein
LVNSAEPSLGDLFLKLTDKIHVIKYCIEQTKNAGNGNIVPNDGVIDSKNLTQHKASGNDNEINEEIIQVIFKLLFSSNTIRRSSYF